MSSELTPYICVQCGVQYAASESPPSSCRICSDERQFVNPRGQSWTTHGELRRRHLSLFRQREAGLWGLRTHPRFAIGQEAHLVETPAGNVLWDCLSLLDEATVELVRARGGLAAIAISHPHFYDSMVEWSRTFGDVPVFLHANDREWVMRPDGNLVFWEEASREILSGVDVVRCGGHFPGASVLHWKAGAEGRGVLLSSDTIQLVPDPGQVSFLYSYPNLIPLAASDVRGILEAVEPLEFDRLYGAFGLTIEKGGKDIVRRSGKRHLQVLG